MSGPQIFVEQLNKIELNAEITANNWIEFEFTVPTGRFIGKKVQMAILVPPDFPRTPPSGIDFFPRLRPLAPGAQHPERSHLSRKDSWKEQGEYLSRPHNTWNQEKNRNAQTYMAFVRQLWEEL